MLCITLSSALLTKETRIICFRILERFHWSGTLAIENASVIYWLWYTGHVYRAENASGKITGYDVDKIYTKVIAQRERIGKVWWPFEKTVSCVDVPEFRITANSRFFLFFVSFFFCLDWLKPCSVLAAAAKYSSWDYFAARRCSSVFGPR